MTARKPTLLTRYFQPLRRRVRVPVWADLSVRVGAALALVSLVVLIHYVDRNGLVDHHDGNVSFLDVVYFTMISITTTGFGDITLPGPAGKLTSIVTMLIGISLFVRLAQLIFRPYKVEFSCPQCALQRHEPDAVHCKACGFRLKIPDVDD